MLEIQSIFVKATKKAQKGKFSSKDPIKLAQVGRNPLAASLHTPLCDFTLFSKKGVVSVFFIQIVSQILY